jgi:hypothetical protein
VLLAPVEEGVKHGEDRLAADRRQILSGPTHEFVIEAEGPVPVGAQVDLLALDLDVPEPTPVAVERLRIVWHVRILRVTGGPEGPLFRPRLAVREGNFSDQLL